MPLTEVGEMESRRIYSFCKYYACGIALKCIKIRRLLERHGLLIWSK